EMPAEESPAGDAREVIGGGEPAVLFQCDAQHGVELGDAPRGVDACIELPVGRAAADAVVGAGGYPSLRVRSFIELSDIHEPGGPARGLRAHGANEIQAVAEHHG